MRKFKDLHFLQNPSGATSFEYVLLIGGVSVAAVVAMGFAPGLGGQLISGMCAALDTLVGPPGTISC